MKVLLFVALSVLAANAVPTLKWYEVQPAKEVKALPMSAGNVKTHWELFKKQHCKFS